MGWRAHSASRTWIHDLIEVLVDDNKTVGTNPAAPQFTPEDGNNGYALSLQGAAPKTQGEIEAGRGIVPGTDLGDAPIHGLPQKAGGYTLAELTATAKVVTVHSTPIIENAPPVLDVKVSVSTDVPVAHANWFRTELAALIAEFHHLIQGT